MTKYTYDFKHKIERDRERERERKRESVRERERERERGRESVCKREREQKPGQAVYYTFSRGVSEPFQHLSKEVILLEVAIFTKISILDVWKGSEYVVA